MRGTNSELVAALPEAPSNERPDEERLEPLGALRDEALRSVADWHWQTDREGVLREAGPTIARSLGWPAQLLAGRPFHDLFADAKGQLARQIEGLLSEQQPFRDRSIALQTRDGGTVAVRLSGVPQYDRRGRFAGYVGTGTEVARPDRHGRDDPDGTAAVLAAEVEKLVMENVRLRIALGEGGRRATVTALPQTPAGTAAEPADHARLAHELRTPLNAIIGYAEFAEGRVTGGEDKVRECLQRILTAARHMDAFIGNGFEPAEKPKLEIAALPLDGLVRDVAAIVEPQARAHAIDISALSVEGTYLVLADRGALTQVLVNLAVNAIKYNRRGGAVGVTVRLEGTDRVALSIWDTGQGIAAEELPHIFEPGFRGKGRAEAESDSEAAGRGLGLAISSDLTRAMGGTIEATSELGQGTQVTLRLRRAPNRKKR